jgi:hypothetical protein
LKINCGDIELGRKKFEEKNENGGVVGIQKGNCTRRYCHPAKKITYP